MRIESRAREAQENTGPGMTFTAVSLFAGVGGFDLAFERAGVEVVAAVEIDRPARGVLADRFPRTKLFTDVTEVTGDDLRTAGFVPERGVIVAGWPCQGNSIAGTRGGLADPRSGLWRHVVRLLAETRAAWFIGENVPGLLSVNRGADFGIVLGDLVDLGMGFAWRILDAQHFGVPQRRRRVFIVGHSGGDARGPVEILFEPESSGRDSTAGESAGPGTSDAAKERSRSSEVFNWVRGGQLDVLPTVDTQGGNPRCNQGGPMVVSALTAQMAGGGGGADDNTAQAGHLIAAPITAREQKGPDADVNSGNIIVQPVAMRGREPGSAIEAGEPGDPAFAVRTPGGGSSYPMIAASAVRRLTPLECERLQGFPDKWTTTSNGRAQSDAPRYHQLGNAVAVPVVEWIIKRFVRVASTRGIQVQNSHTPELGTRGVRDRVGVGAPVARDENDAEPLEGRFDLTFNPIGSHATQIDGGGHGHVTLLSVHSADALNRSEPRQQPATSNPATSAVQDENETEPLFDLHYSFPQGRVS